jgi:hypothetical protein
MPISKAIFHPLLHPLLKAKALINTDLKKDRF